MRFSSSHKKRGGNSLKKYYETHLLGWVGALLILYGYYLNANGIIQSWLVWIVGNSLIGAYCLKKEAYPTAAMSFILVILNIYGYLNWLDK